MKKYLFILLSVISLTAFSDVTYEEAVIENLQDMGSNVSDIQFQLSNFFSSDPENGYDLPLRDVFYWSLYDPEYPPIPTIMGNIFDVNLSFLPYLESINGWLYNEIIPYLNDHSPLDILFYLQDGNVADNIFSIDQGISNGFGRNHADLIDVRDSIHDLEMKQEGYLQGISGNTDQITGSLETIIGLLQNQGGGSSGDLPIDTVGYYELGEYGKDVNIKGLSFHSVTTTGEYNKDVLRLLLNLNNVCGSQMNAALSILTNVQEIASSVTGSSEGEEKAEKDVEERSYKANQALAEANSINSIDWSSYFTMPKFLSDSWNSLTIYLADTDLPSRITVIDTFHFNSESFTVELSDIGFDLPQGAIDLAFYIRQVFGFIYWSLAFCFALFVSKLWVRFYLYVSKCLFDK